MNLEKNVLNLSNLHIIPFKGVKLKDEKVEIPNRL